jgi:tRNA(Arg) A34 adenosine deaminase TadA
MLSRRILVASLGGVACVGALHAASAASSLPASIPMSQHERAMRLAIAEARRNPVYPFGAVIVRAADGAVSARGVNATRVNPILHGEIAAMNDYVARHGNKDWADHILYTTGEPCSMCMSALVWAGIGGVVFASSIDGIRRAGIAQIDIAAKAVIDASPFYRGMLLGGVLEAETDRLFMQRKRQ